MATQVGFVHACSVAVRAGDMSTCKPLGFDLVGWIAILTAIAGGLAFLTSRVQKRTHHGRPAKFRRLPWRNRFKALCAAIKPLMDENSRLFQQFGPNSGVGDGRPKAVRMDVSAWKELIPKIAANNARIRELIIANRAAIPTAFELSLAAWIDHIDAFKVHVANPRVDYRDKQFPVEVLDIVSRHV